VSDPITIGAFIRCHRRALTLRIALTELFRYADTPGLIVKVHVLADRPNFLVERVLADFRHRLFGLLYSPFPLVSSSGERFMEAANLQLKAFERSPPDFYFYGDDDRWLQPPGSYSELPIALANPDVDLWYANSVFFHDNTDTFRTNTAHHSPLLWRHLDNDHFPPTSSRIIQATTRRHDDAIAQSRTATLRTPLLDYGTFSADERLRVYRAYKGAGKVDSVTESCTDPAPSLLKFPADALSLGLTDSTKWTDLFLEAQLAKKP
jgi:hypothetical protein